MIKTLPDNTAILKHYKSVHDIYCYYHTLKKHAYYTENLNYVKQ